MRPMVPLVVVAAMLLTAGCTGGLAGGTATPSGPVYDLPLDGETVANGHNDSLRAAGSFTADTNMSVTEPAGESFQMTSTTAIDLDRGTMYANLSTRGLPDQAIYVGPDRTAYQRIQLSSGDVQYRSLAQAPATDAFYELPVAVLIEEANFSYAGRSRVAGASVSVYTVTELEEAVAPSRLRAVETGTIEDFEVRLAIDDDGVIRRFYYRVETMVDGSTRVIAMSITYRDVGTTTVDRPGWADEVE